MESMLSFLSSCLKKVDLDTVTKADLRRMYLKAKGLDQLSRDDKKLFSVAVKSALEDFQKTRHEITVKSDLKEEEMSTAVEDSSGKINTNHSVELDSYDDFSPENEIKTSFSDKKKSGRKILSDSEMSAEEDNKEIIMKTNKKQNGHVLDDEMDSNQTPDSKDDENSKDATSNLSAEKDSIKISDDESSQEALATGKGLANGHKKRLRISSSSGNDNSSEDDSLTQTTTPKQKKIKLSNNASAKLSQEKKSNRVQKKSSSSKRQVVSSSDSEEEVKTKPLKKGKKSSPSSKSVKQSTKKNVSESDDESIESPNQASSKASSDSEEEVITKPLKKGRKKPLPKSVKSSKKNVSESDNESIESSNSSKASSESENESLALLSRVKSTKSLNVVKGTDEMDERESSSDDEPLVNISNKKLNKINGKPTDKKKLVASEEDSSNKTDSSNDSEDEPLVKKNSKYNSIKKSPQVDSSKTKDSLLSNFSKRKSNITVANEISSAESGEDTPKSKPRKNDSASDSEDEPVIKFAKKSTSKVSQDKLVRKSLDAVNGSNNEDSGESEDEPLTKFAKGKLNKTNSKPVANEMNSIESEEETLKSKPRKLESASDSEDEPIIKLSQKSNKNIKTGDQSAKRSIKNKELDWSDSDEEPLVKKINTSVDNSSLSKDSSGSSIDENEEQSSKKDKSSKKEKASNSVKEKKRPSASENKIEHLKKYVRAAGIRVQNYTKLFKDCKSMKAKSETLIDLLEKHGLKGKPTLEKCKKLKKKIETKKEIAELDLSNILKTEGRRPKRSVCVDTTNYTEQVEKTPTPVKRFSRLQDIVDSEGSD